ncbi:MAG TPA: YhjD/YihY/BrkB family envelope integrity protein [Planctomycetota bacterium]|nr:YhjD/YihY/BrkB family envelope integrity protein [Planctomycetota bacterium]
MKDSKLYRRSVRFLLHDLWTREVGKGWRATLTYVLRTGVLVVENTWNRELLVRAAALTYQVVFAVIPLFAVSLALFKTFGGFQKVAGDVRDFLLRNLAPNLGEQVVQTMNNLIDRMDAKAISIVGFAILLYTSVSLLSTVEGAFNRIWGVRRSRSLVRRLTVYWTLLTFGPVCLAISLAVTGFVRNQGAYRWILENVPLANMAMLVIVPCLLTWVVFTAMYKIIPNTRVSWSAAVIGALVGGTAWEILKGLFILYNDRVVASYEVYGTLSAIPIFLLWIYLSWVLVLFGGEIAFAAQHVKTYRREVDAPKLSHAFMERLAVHLMVEIARDFIGGRDPATSEALADRLKVPVRACNDVLFHLTGGGLLREVSHGQVTTYLPAEDLDRITVKRIVDALRRHGDEPALAVEGVAGDRLGRILQEAEESSSKQLDQVTLRELTSETKGP